MRDPVPATITLRARSLLILALALVVISSGVATVVGYALTHAPAAQAAPAPQGIGPEAVPVSVPKTFNYRGLLREANGALTNGTFKVTARIYANAAGGSADFTENFNGVPVRDGLFSVVLGDSVSLGTALDNLPRYIGITLNDGAEIIPRERIHSVPWAIFATNAALADSATNATNASHATNATDAAYAANAGNAAMAQDLDNMTVEIASAFNFDNGSQVEVDLPFVLSEGRGYCFLSAIITQHADTKATCTIDHDGDRLIAGAYNYCEATCVQWDGTATALTAEGEGAEEEK